MSTPVHDHDPTAAAPKQHGPSRDDHAGHSGWLMLLCCIPMVVAVVLILLR